MITPKPFLSQAEYPPPPLRAAHLNFLAVLSGCSSERSGCCPCPAGLKAHPMTTGLPHASPKAALRAALQDLADLRGRRASAIASWSAKHQFRFGGGGEWSGAFMFMDSPPIAVVLPAMAKPQINWLAPIRAVGGKKPFPRGPAGARRVSDRSEKVKLIWEDLYEWNHRYRGLGGQGEILRTA
jgi:hypothetical protein